jgi:hypothetical protein
MCCGALSHFSVARCIKSSIARRAEAACVRPKAVQITEAIRRQALTSTHCETQITPALVLGGLCAPSHIQAVTIKRNLPDRERSNLRHLSPFFCAVPATPTSRSHGGPLEE